jgi:hypothetical protein
MSKYKVREILNNKITKANTLQSEIYKLIEEAGKAQILAWVSLVIDQEVPYETIKELLGKFVESLNDDSIELYHQIKDELKER